VNRFALLAIAALGLIPTPSPAGPLAISASPPEPLDTCSASCDKKASDCVDACEAKYQEAKPRVECKVVCITEREKCEKDCK
jgi:hypothetical protein